jgi:hypothetical protein
VLRLFERELRTQGLPPSALRRGFESAALDYPVPSGPAPDRQFVLPRADRAISNLKTWLQGTHRSASAKHLQVYLDEFVFRHNRRCTPMAAFQTLLGLGALHEPTTYREITARAAA